MKKTRRRGGGLLLSLWLVVGPVCTALAGEADLPRPVPPPPRPSEWIADPGVWEQLEEADIEAPDGTHWRLSVDIREIGRLRAESREVPVTLPRVWIGRLVDGTMTGVSVLLPIDSRDLTFLPPGSPEIDAVASTLRRDSVDRWPNPCRFAILDASGQLDIDADGLPEVALRRFCSCTAPGCSGITLLELDPAGPNELDPATLVADLDLRRVSLVELIPAAEPSRPKLQIEPDFLEDCRFVSAIGVRGRNECPTCCRFPVILGPIEGGRYEPIYERSVHARHLQRAREDLQYVAAGDPNERLQSFEEAQIARSAAFFYLTGTGERTRSVVLEGLGPRQRDLRVISLLIRLDRFFLRPRPR